MTVNFPTTNFDVNQCTLQGTNLNQNPIQGYGNTIFTNTSNYTPTMLELMKNPSQVYNGTIFNNTSNNTSYLDSVEIQQQQQQQQNVEILRQKLKDVMDEQGIIGNFWNGVKNFFNVGASSNKAEKAIEQYQRGEISFEEAEAAINNFKTKQKGGVDLLTSIGTGLAVAGAIAAAPFTGGASLALGIAVGAGVKAGSKFLDRASNKVEGDALDAKQIAKDAVTGALDGAVTVLTAGIGKAAKTAGKAAGEVATTAAQTAGTVAGEAAATTVKQTVKSAMIQGGLQGAKRGAITGAAMGGGNYIIESIFEDDVDFTLDGLVSSTVQGAAVGGAIGGATGAISSGMKQYKINVQEAKANAVAGETPNQAAPTEKGASAESSNAKPTENVNTANAAENTQTTPATENAGKPNVTEGADNLNAENVSNAKNANSNTQAAQNTAPKTTVENPNNIKSPTETATPAQTNNAPATENAGKPNVTEGADNLKAENVSNAKNANSNTQAAQNTAPKTTVENPNNIKNPTETATPAQTNNAPATESTGASVAEGKTIQERIRAAEQIEYTNNMKTAKDVVNNHMQELDDILLDENGRIKYFDMDKNTCSSISFEELVTPYDEDLGTIYHGTSAEAKTSILKNGFSEDIAPIHGYKDGAGGTYFTQVKSNMYGDGIIEAEFTGNVGQANTDIMNNIKLYYSNRFKVEDFVEGLGKYDKSSISSEAILQQYIRQKIADMGYQGIMGSNYSFAANCRYFTALDPSLIKIIS